MDLLSVDTIDAARTKLVSLTESLFTRHQPCPLLAAPGRVLARDLFATEAVPGFARSTVDGYALLAADSAGASESLPVILSLNAAVEMGKPAPAQTAITSGHCAYVPTGGMLPAGADAMVMVEQTETVGESALAIYGAVTTAENVVQPGEDAQPGALILPRGRRLRAQELGVCAALGVTEVEVFSAPRLMLVSTGDELVSLDQTPGIGQVRDVNSTALAAQARHAGFEPIAINVLPDDPLLLAAAIADAKSQCDLIVISGGSSQGEKDATARIIAEASDRELLTHGLAVKPGKPTILGFDEGSQTLMVGLPGHPMAAMMVFEILLTWTLNEVRETLQALPVQARLTRNLATAPGRETLQLVRLSLDEELDGRLQAAPLHAKSGLITRLADADGYLRIDRNREGLRAGDTVFVYPFSM